MEYLIYIFAGLGAGVVTGLAGLSAAVIITPLLVGACGWNGYDTVTIALAADVLASLLTSYTYYKNGNIDLKQGIKVSLSAFAGSVLGSYLGYLFSLNSEYGLGYLVMILNIFLGIKFLRNPVTGQKGVAASGDALWEKKRSIAAVAAGFLIGVECGFMGSGGGILMLSVFIIILNRPFKPAVATSTMLKTLVAQTGALSHVALGADLQLIPGITIITACLLGAVVSAKYANRCDNKKLNRIVGVTLILLSIISLALGRR